MRVGKDNFKGLVDIRQSKKFKTDFVVRPQFEKEVNSSIESIVKDGLDKVMYLTTPIIQAVDFGPEGTAAKLISLRSEINTTTKCYLYKSQEKPSSPCVYNTIFVHFEKQQEQTVFMIFGYIDVKKDQLPFYIAGSYRHDDEHFNKYYIADFSYIKSDAERSLKNKFIVNTVELVVQIEVFLQYAELNTKFLKPHHRDMEGVLCKYDNKTGGNITIVDSTWYTSLIKSDAFKVRGHFRLQPHGHGLKQRKLIWIHEFQKEGYVREANILSEHPTTAGKL